VVARSSCRQPDLLEKDILVPDHDPAGRSEDAWRMTGGGSPCSTFSSVIGKPRTRTARARELLETTALPIEYVAAQAGFPSAAALRARFADDLDTTPTAYRRTFRGRARAR
jgi:AraC-like DNA-binding protein